MLTEAKIPKQNREERLRNPAFEKSARRMVYGVGVWFCKQLLQTFVLLTNRIYRSPNNDAISERPCLSAEESATALNIIR